MNTTKLILLLAAFFLTKDAVAQQLCLRVDSIKVYAVPMSMHTTIAMDEEAVRMEHFDEVKKMLKVSLKKEMVIDSIDIIQELLSIELVDSVRKSSRKDVDPRIVLDIYSNKGFFTLSVDNHFTYKYFSNCYLSNAALTAWLKKYIID